jgi:hypothetical protein
MPAQDGRKSKYDYVKIIYSENGVYEEFQLIEEATFLRQVLGQAGVRHCVGNRIRRFGVI